MSDETQKQDTGRSPLLSRPIPPDEPKEPALPELLAPAGSRAALEAAIDAGADAVYMAGQSFGARAYADNFTEDGLRDAISLCHSYGIRAYITLNTMVYGREIPAWLSMAERVWEDGADALIVADLGAAQCLRSRLPKVRLHASTQMSVHNSRGAAVLASLGYSRVVLARELSACDLRLTTENSPIETEAFIHGALCVSASGQCLMSSVIGGRSGNRGECAQPCRLPYNGKPLLSLRDNCLARHITELLSTGVRSLKIEGRMKPAAYVSRVVSVYRRLLDERRDATPDEVASLSEAFSRSGFTDGYFTGKKTGMTGVRTDSDKQKSAALSFDGLTRRIPVAMRCEIRENAPAVLTLTGMGHSVTVCSDKKPEKALTSPLDETSVARCLGKLGGTPYVCDKPTVVLSPGLMLFMGELNALRRRGVAAFAEAMRPERTVTSVSVATDDAKKRHDYVPRPMPRGASARFTSQKQMSLLPDGAFCRRYLPLSAFTEGSRANGVELPPLSYEREDERLPERLSAAYRDGARYALCPNLSAIRLCRELGFFVTADFRLNCASAETAQALFRLGADEVILSAELPLCAMRGIAENEGTASVIVYGHQPLMLTERCFGRDIGFCDRCRRGEPIPLRDRTGAVFLCLPTDGHRMVVYNSVPTYMADKQTDLPQRDSFVHHFLFSTENAAAVRNTVLSYREGREPTGKVRRIRKSFI